MVAPVSYLALEELEVPEVCGFSGRIRDVEGKSVAGMVSALRD
jgi:hypothetical protein